LKKQLLIC